MRNPDPVTIEFFEREVTKVFREGVRVTIPVDTYTDKYDGVTQRDILIGKKKKMYYVDPNGKDFKWVINFYVYYKDDNGKEEIIENLSSCKMKVWVTHNPNKHGNKKQLYWLDPRTGKPKPIGKYKDANLSDEVDGYSYEELDFWGDPNIGWG